MTSRFTASSECSVRDRTKAIEGELEAALVRRGQPEALFRLGSRGRPTLLLCSGEMQITLGNAMTNATTVSSIPPVPSLETAWQDVHSSFERFCLTAGIGVLEQMLREDAERLVGPRHCRNRARAGHRWGATKGKIGFHGGNVAVRRARVRSGQGHEVPLPSWQAAQAEDWLGAMNLMLINVSTRKVRRAVRLPEGDLPAVAGDGTSKSAASRRFVALSAARMAEWVASDLSQLDLCQRASAKSS